MSCPGSLERRLVFIQFSCTATSQDPSVDRQDSLIYRIVVEGGNTGMRYVNSEPPNSILSLGSIAFTLSIFSTFLHSSKTRYILFIILKNTKIFTAVYKTRNLVLEALRCLNSNKYFSNHLDCDRRGFLALSRKAVAVVNGN